MCEPHVLALGPTPRCHSRLVSDNHRQHLGHGRTNARKGTQQEVVELLADKPLLAHLGSDLFAEVAARTEQVVYDSHVGTADLFALLHEETGKPILNLCTAETEQSSENNADAQENHCGLFERQAAYV